MMNDLDKKIGEYDISRKLGFGSFGSVYLCSKGEGTKYAIKVVSKQDVNAYQVLLNGMKIVDTLYSAKANAEPLVGLEWIVKMFERIDVPLYIAAVLEYIEGVELFDFIIQNHIIIDGHALGLEEFRTKIIIRQLMQAVNYVHSCGIVHGDIKLENIMVANDYTGTKIKLIDFGLGQIVDETQSVTRGSEPYLSPEIVMRLDRNPYKSDIWACGIILFAACTSRLPFDNRTLGRTDSVIEYRSMLRRIAVGTYSFTATENTSITSDCQYLIADMLVRDQNNRKEAAELLMHPWFQ